jgi:hypothetical protein
VDDQTVRLSELTAKSKVVLIVLRGWLSTNVHFASNAYDYAASASGFGSHGTRRDGLSRPAENLKTHAKEFLDNKQ